MTSPNPTDLPVFAARSATARPAARSLAGPTVNGHHHGSMPTPGHSLYRPVPPKPALSRPEPVPVFERPDPNGGADIVALAVDHEAVRQLRGSVLRAFADDHPGVVPSPVEHGDLLRSIAEAQLEDYSTARIRAGLDALTADQRSATTGAVLDAMFGLGRMTGLLEEEGLENLEIEGHDNVWMSFADGTIRRGRDVADSDADLISDIQTMARYSVNGEKDFSPARPYLRMSLPDGSRMAAEAWMTPRPSITIRKHRFVDTDLAEMRALGAIDAGLEQFITAAIRARKNIVVSGPPSAGKTTMTRALLAALSPIVRLATIETNYELFLHQMPNRHYRVWAAEYQPGGEPGPDGEPIGKIPVIKLVELALQKNVDYIVVGEVVGPEIVAMLESMQAGKGSVSTVHASSAWDTVERMATLVMRAQENASTAFAQRLIAQHIDLVIHIDVIDETHLEGGRRHRFVDQVLALGISGEDDPVERELLWDRGRDRRAVATGKVPRWIDELEEHGFDRDWLQEGVHTWDQPLDLLRTRNEGQR